MTTTGSPRQETIMSLKGSMEVGPHEQGEAVRRKLEERRGELRQLRRAAWLARHTAPPEPRPESELRRIEVETQQAIIRHALRTGRVDLIRHAGRLLRVRDFAAEPRLVEPLLGVIRDARSGDDEILEAAGGLVALSPAPA